MTARRIKGSWWADFTIEKVRYRKRSPDNSQAGAKAYEALLRKRLARGEPVVPEIAKTEPTLGEFAPVWFETYVKANNKPSEQRSKEMILRVHLLPAFGNTPLRAIRAQDIERFKAAQLAKKLNPKTVNNQLTVLRSCLSRAVEWGHFDSLPRIKLLQSEPPERDFLTVDEGVRLVQAADSPMWKAMTLLALRTGMRLGEICGLQWSCVNMELGVITVRQSIVDGITSSPKNHRQRFVPFPRSVAEALLALPRQDTSLVFCRADGQPLSKRIATRALHRACAAARLRQIGWHTLRHSCASQLGMLRGTLLEAQRLLGHSSIQMTERYTHVVPALLHQAVSDLDRAAIDASAARATGGQPSLAALIMAPQAVDGNR